MQSGGSPYRQPLPFCIFSLHATGNYIIAVILMLVLLVGANAGYAWLSAKSSILSAVFGIGFVVLLIWLPIRDIRKAVLYFKSTI